MTIYDDCLVNYFCYAAGAELMMNAYKANTHHKRLRGMGQARALLNRA